MASKVVRFAIAGLGGYAGNIRDLLSKCQGDASFGPVGVNLVAVCDPAIAQFEPVVKELSARGVRVHNDYAAMLKDDFDAVWLPVPIHLHRPFFEQAMSAGRAVICEKPAAGCIDDLDAMIAARDRAGLAAAIGFQNIYDPSTPVIKKLFAGGIIGDVQSITLVACWTRGDTYYSRNNWAGALKRSGTWVLDSPANNAAAHFINLALFWLGDEPELSADPVSVDAELYRARAIENYDTANLRIALPHGRHFLVYYTHACEGNFGPVAVVHGSRGRMKWNQHQGAIFTNLDGQEIRNLPSTMNKAHTSMAQRFAQEVVGDVQPGIALGTLEVARAHLKAICGASEAVKIVNIPADSVNIMKNEKDTYRVIPGIREMFLKLAEERRMLHEAGTYPWCVPAGTKNLVSYKHFAGPA